jgi:hypothetical protein
MNSDTATRKGTTASAIKVSVASICHIIKSKPAMVMRACRGANSSVSTTVCTDQESPVIRLSKSPTALRL